MINFLCTVSCCKITFSFLCPSEVHVIHSFPSRLKGFPLSTPFLKPLSFQIPSLNHAIAFLSFNLQQNVYT
jgi:hypothetical protein